MSTRLKMVLLDPNGAVADFRFKPICKRAQQYNPELQFTGNRAKDFELARGALLEGGYFLFGWKEAKEARGRELVVKELMRQTMYCRHLVTSRMVYEELKGRLKNLKPRPASGLKKKTLGDLMAEGAPIARDWADEMIVERER